MFLYLYTNKAVLNIEQYSIGNQWRVFLTGMMYEYLAVWLTTLAKDYFEHIQADEDQEQIDSLTRNYSSQIYFQRKHSQP